MSMFGRKYRWEKMGLIIAPRSELWWMRTHAMNPTPGEVDGSFVKIYFAGRDDRNRSQIGWAAVDLDRDGTIVDFAKEPVLPLGDLGCFDDNGVAPVCIVDVEKRKYLYYVGFKPGGTTRMDLFAGLAVSDDGGMTFGRYSRAPILERNRVNPFINTGPWVICENGLWRMYYVAGKAWVHPDLPRYNIQYATSEDGLEWHREGHVCIDFKSEDEHALARPFVLKENGVYKMWFAHKGDVSKGSAYRIGYAESENGTEWVRDDSYAGINVSDSGWDSDMIEYAVIVSYSGRKFMFYNGNNYGYDGIGLAVEK